MTADRRKQIEGAITALGSLRSAVASEQSRILDEVVALLASLDGELASLSAKLRWHASAPFRSKKDEAPEGQLAFELLRMLTGRLGQESAADGVQPSEGDAPPTASRGAAACGAGRPRSGPGTAAAATRIASWPRTPASPAAWPRSPMSPLRWWQPQASACVGAPKRCGYRLAHNALLRRCQRPRF